jgi:mono/diheme cytochrome c family protein
MKTIVTQLALLLLIGCPLAAQAKQQDRQTEKPHATSTTASPGAALYKRHCAVCHGNDLKGNGPAPEPFRQETPDLTTLAKRHEGIFPDAYVAGVLKNGVKIKAHAPAEMPLWGTTFQEAEGLTGPQVTQRIADLVSYIKSKQQK